MAEEKERSEVMGRDEYMNALRANLLSYGSSLSTGTLIVAPPTDLPAPLATRVCGLIQGDREMAREGESNQG
jgi:hypothetical protein